MADLSATWELELLEQFSGLTAATDEETAAEVSSENSDNNTGLLHLSDEVLLVILRNLEPMSLLRLGSTCSVLFRICSCNSLWTRHFQVKSHRFDILCFSHLKLKAYFLAFCMKSLKYIQNSHFVNSFALLFEFIIILML